ncbi:MAG TPA: cupin domain-containing protein [Ramlibacter sp.]|uniref:cupin domain-containing protein n=1 Tax=Ramlibacter sp. TaxID=1917967 RepID=UPI002CE6161F|nr:cupin domain-containing protein [Ramlibacter sp.]HVZ45501.1 cupin domain-containing protein [Ramlibacter sp.]
MAEMFPDAAHKPTAAEVVGMHTTATIDYALILYGEIVAVLDEGEKVLRAGDVLIQRGTSHAWANRSTEVARVAFVLIDAESAS